MTDKFNYMTVKKKVLTLIGKAAVAIRERKEKKKSAALKKPATKSKGKLLSKVVGKIVGKKAAKNPTKQATKKSNKRAKPQSRKKPLTPVLSHGPDLHLIPVTGEIHPARKEEATLIEQGYKHNEEVALHREQQRAKQILAATNKRVFKTPRQS